MDMSTSLDALTDCITGTITEDPLQGLRDIAAAQQRLIELESLAVDAAILQHSWADIGAAMGTSRQAAQQRFKDKLKAQLIATTKVYKVAKSKRDPQAIAAAREHQAQLVQEFRKLSKPKKK
ncbi:MAG: hypothetical protein WC005_05865 [Candidatus Nanopelagicales bacterium]